MTLKGKQALATGGSRGIGRGIVPKLAEDMDTRRSAPLQGGIAARAGLVLCVLLLVLGGVGTVRSAWAVHLPTPGDFGVRVFTNAGIVFDTDPILADESSDSTNAANPAIHDGLGLTCDTRAARVAGNTASAGTCITTDSAGDYWRSIASARSSDGEAGGCPPATPTCVHASATAEAQSYDTFTVSPGTSGLPAGTPVELVLRAVVHGLIVNDPPVAGRITAEYEVGARQIRFNPDGSVRFVSNIGGSVFVFEQSHGVKQFDLRIPMGSAEIGERLIVSTFTFAEGRAGGSLPSFPERRAQATGSFYVCSSEPGVRVVGAASGDAREHCPGQGPADIAVTKAASADSVKVGENLNYSITVTNNGPDEARSVSVIDLIPDDVTEVVGSPLPAECRFDTWGQLHLACTFPVLLVGESRQVQIGLQPTSEGELRNSVGVYSRQPDPDESNNAATVVTTVREPSADLAITLTDSPDPVAVGSNLSYFITVTNHGPDDASNAVALLLVPQDLPLVSAPPGCEPGGCDIPALAAGATVTFEFVFAPAAVGEIQAQAGLVVNESDPQPANNVAAATTTVQLLPALPPVADAGPDQTVGLRSLVTLNGSNSSDPVPGPAPLSFAWTQTGGLAVALTGATTATPTFTPGVTGSYTFSLVVHDGLTSSAPDSVTITVLTPLDLLVSRVAILDLPHGQRNSLTSKIEAAAQASTLGHRGAATNQLNAFINEVRALGSNGRLDAATAAALVELARAVIDAM